MLHQTLYRECILQVSEQTLCDIHAALCHPGVTRMIHFVKTKSLLYSVEDVRKMIAACRVCPEVKPRFHKPPGVPLTKATQPFERLSLDFKGPLSSSSKNKYIFMVIDEFSRFLFAFPCANMESKTVIQCLTQLFSLFGMCSCIHSDNAASFTSCEFLDFLHKFGISVSRTSVYNPRGNGQTERYNGIVWSAAAAALKSRNLPVTQWETVLRMRCIPCVPCVRRLMQHLMSECLLFHVVPASAFQSLRD